MKLKMIIAAMLALVLSGCVGIADGEGWHRAQKKEFMRILANDSYMSICDQQPLYTHVKETENPVLMSKLLYKYAENLANGCIVNATLPEEEFSEDRTSSKVVSMYGTYLQKVSHSDINRKLQAGLTIREILQPYTPEYEQFFLLINGYQRLKAVHKSPALLRKIRLNIERVKLMKPGLGKTYALINIPEFMVRIIEEDLTAVKMGVVVGKPKLPTPIFSEDLSYITLNPQWSVPDSIARKEVIPKLLKDPNYLTKKRMVMRKTYDLNSPELTPSTVDLESYRGGEGYVPFKFIEVPSKRNGLGRVKFIFPNKHAVYMHDTQSKYLFKRKIRAYSHGCVRLSQPMVMLNYIGAHYTSTPIEQIHEEYDSLKTHYIKLTKRLPVHTAYLTTYVDDCNNLIVSTDIYGYDQKHRMNFELMSGVDPQDVVDHTIL